MDLGFIVDFFNWLWGFLTTGIYDFFVELVAWLVIKTAIWWIEMQIYMIGFAWDVARTILDDLAISSHLAAAWGGVESETRDILSFFAVPEMVNIILSAAATKYVLRFLGVG
jgi:hypothetical protein